MFSLCLWLVFLFAILQNKSSFYRIKNVTKKYFRSTSKVLCLNNCWFSVSGLHTQNCVNAGNCKESLLCSGKTMFHQTKLNKYFRTQILMFKALTQKWKLDFRVKKG